MFSLTLSADHLSIINTALQEMPMRLAYPVVAEINRQLASAAADQKVLPEPEVPDTPHREEF